MLFSKPCERASLAGTALLMGCVVLGCDARMASVESEDAATNRSVTEIDTSAKAKSKSRSGRGRRERDLQPCRHRPRIVPPDAPLPETVDDLFAEALGVGTRLVERYPKVPDAHEVSARIRYNVGCIAEAEANWRTALRLSPDYAYALHGLGLVAAKRCDHVEAVRFQTEALKRMPGLADAARYAAEAHLRLGDADAAIRVLRETLRQSPSDPELKVRLGHALIAAGRYSDAAQSFREVIDELPNTPRAHYGLTLALARAGKDDDAAAARASYRMVRANERRETRKEREREGDLTRQKRLLAEHYVSASRIHLAHRRADDAASLARRAARLAPEDVASRELYVNLASQRGDLPAALNACQELISIDPDNPGYRVTLAMLHERSGTPAQARAVYEKLVDEGVAVAEAHAALARFHYRQNSIGDAIRHAREATRQPREATRNQPAAAHLAMLAQLLAESGQLEDAAEAVDRAVEIEPENPEWSRLRKLIRNELP